MREKAALTPEDRQLRSGSSRWKTARPPDRFPDRSVRLDRQYATFEPAEDGGTRVLLTPRAPRPDLAWLRLATGADGNLRTLSYEDSSGSRRNSIRGLAQEKARPASDYRITGPPGTGS
jgi:hypothetical protein